MNERLTELYRSCRSKEGLASQDEYKSADVLLGTEVAKFAELIVQECVKILVTSEGNENTSDAVWDLEELGVDVSKILNTIRS